MCDQICENLPNRLAVQELCCSKEKVALVSSSHLCSRTSMRTKRINVAQSSTSTAVGNPLTSGGRGGVTNRSYYYKVDITSIYLILK